MPARQPHIGGSEVRIQVFSPGRPQSGRSGPPPLPSPGTKSPACRVKIQALPGPAEPDSGHPGSIWGVPSPARDHKSRIQNCQTKVCAMLGQCVVLVLRINHKCMLRDKEARAGPAPLRDRACQPHPARMEQKQKTLQFLAACASRAPGLYSDHPWQSEQCEQRAMESTSTRTASDATSPCSPYKTAQSGPRPRTPKRASHRRAPERSREG